MAVHWGGRGPGHLSRLAKAAGGVSAPSTMSVLSSGGSSYSAPLAVLTSAGASNTVTTSVRAADGTAYVVI